MEIKKSSKKVPIAKKKKQASVKISWVGEVVEVNLTGAARSSAQVAVFYG